MKKIPSMAAIILICTAAAVLYGVLHDQITARVCVEYFTVFHPRLIATESPTLLGLFWGVWATWWVGFLLGVPLAVAAQAGSLPPVRPSELIRPLGRLLLIMALLATTAALVGGLGTAAGRLNMPPVWAERIPADRHARFLADLWAHNTSYLSGFLGGNVLLGWAWRERRRREARAAATASEPSLTPGAPGPAA